MTTTMQRRVEALEGPGGRACLSCELARLGQTSVARTDTKLPTCTHWPAQVPGRRTVRTRHHRKGRTVTTVIAKRVEALESAGAAGVDFLLILRRFITPGVPPGEATQAQALGQTFTREQGETESQFIERIRAYALAHRRPGQYGMQVLMEEIDVDL